MLDPLNIMILLLQVLIPLIIGAILYSSTLVSRWRGLIFIFLILGVSFPFAYSLFMEQSMITTDSHNGLELSILFVWVSSSVLGILALIRIYLKITRHKI